MLACLRFPSCSGSCGLHASEPLPLMLPVSHKLVASERFPVWCASDLSQPVCCRYFIGTWNMKGFLSEDRPIRTLREITTRLQEAYCNTVGYEVSLQLLPLH